MTVEGVKKLGIETVPPIVTRGVVLDMDRRIRQRHRAGENRVQRRRYPKGLGPARHQHSEGRRGAVQHRCWIVGKDTRNSRVEPGIGMAAANGWRTNRSSRSR